MDDKIKNAKNDGLRVEALTRDLGDKLANLKVKLPVFISVGYQISMVTEENDVNYPVFDRSRLSELKLLISNYILNKKLAGDSLWQNVNINLPADPTELDAVVINNFKKKADGTVVWTDPFVYSKPI